MAAELNLYSSTGKLKLSSSLIGWFCKKTISGVTVAATVGNTVDSQIVVDKTGLAYPIFAVRMPGYAVGIASSAGSNSTFVTNAPVGTAYSLYVYEYSPTLPFVTSGIQIRTAAGDIVFNSGYPPLLVLDDVAFGGAAFTDAGKDLAGASLSYGGRSGPNGTFGIWRCYTGPTFTNWTDGSCPSVRYNNSGKIYGASLSSDGHGVDCIAISFDDVQITYGPTDFSDSRASIAAEREWNTSVSVLAIDVTGIPVPATFY